jgi:hypothetical protein
VSLANGRESKKEGGHLYPTLTKKGLLEDGSGDYLVRRESQGEREEGGGLTQLIGLLPKDEGLHFRCCE